MAIEIYLQAKLIQLEAWQDVRMNKIDTTAMKEGVLNSKCCVAIVTGPCINPDRPTDNPEENAYFRREYCNLELRWARDAGKKIVCVVRMEDKDKVEDFFRDAPDDLQYLKDHVVLFDRNDGDYQNIAVQRVFVKGGLCETERLLLGTTATSDPPPTTNTNQITNK